MLFISYTLPCDTKYTSLVVRFYASVLLYTCFIYDTMTNGFRPRATRVCGVIAHYDATMTMTKLFKPKNPKTLDT